MELYIDINNLKSFIKSKDSDDFDDCKRRLRRQLHVIYNFDKELLRSEPVLQQFVTMISEGRGRSEESDKFLSSTSMFPERPIKSNSYSKWDWQQLSSVYLIDDVDSRKLKDKGCVLIGDAGEEISILMRLFCGMDYDFHHLYDLQKNFNSWEQLTADNQTLPCTDIVLNDRYLFSNTYDLVECNLRPLLTVLAGKVRNRINIVVFTKYCASDKNGKHTALLEFGVDKATSIIKDTLEKTTGMKPNVTFVTSNDNDKIPHDRFIITNYRLIRSGDSFLYFDTKGKKITNGGALDIDSMANHETYTFVQSLLEKLQACYNDIARLNNDMIIGSKESKFIRFNN